MIFEEVWALLIRTKRIVILGLLFGCLAAAPASSQTTETISDSGYEWSEKKQAARADLFAALKDAENDAEARQLEGLIWRLWFEPDDAEIASRMKQVMELRRLGDYGRAMELIDEVIEIDPSYPESWNQRATILFLYRDFDASLEAVQETLKREPNHFGALSGQMMIFLNQGKPALARSSLLQALKVNPWLRERALLEKGQVLSADRGVEL